MLISPLLSVAEKEGRMHLQIKLNIDSTIKHFQQALTNKDYNVKVQACDGAVETSALHITSKWVWDMAQDRGCCRHEPVLFLPDTDKKTVALLDRILLFGSAQQRSRSMRVVISKRSLRRYEIWLRTLA